MISMKFSYNDRGRGDLVVYRDDVEIDRRHCRTGSIDTAGDLVHALTTGAYDAIYRPMKTKEVGMFIEGEEGWKLRLYRVVPEGYNYRGICIHPDGPKDHTGNGTKGCIGTPTDAWELYELFLGAFADQDKIRVDVSLSG